MLGADFQTKAFIPATLVLAALATAASQAVYESSAEYNNATIASSFLNYTDASNAPLRGYFSYNTERYTAGSPLPLVLIVPDWDGIGEYEEWRSKLVADLGYAAFVADVYTTNVIQGPSLSTAARTNLTKIYSNQTLILTRLVGALDYAKTLPQVDPTKLVAIGYCFGGSAIIQLLRAWPDAGVENLLGIMSFHGSGIAYKAGDRNITEGNPIRASFQQGYLDPTNTRAQIMSLQDELEAANVTWEFTEYSYTVHAFTEPDLPLLTPATESTATMAYDPVSGVRSWWALRTFLLDVFGATDIASPYVGAMPDMDSGIVATS